MNTIEMGVVCLESGRLEVRQYGPEGAVCRQTEHPAADLLAIAGPAGDAARAAVASPGTVCPLQIVRAPKKRKPRKAKAPTWKGAKRKPRQDTTGLNWQSAGWK